MGSIEVVAWIGGGFSIAAILIQSWLANRINRKEHAQNAEINGANTELIATVLQTINVNEARHDSAAARIEGKVDHLGRDFRGHIKDGHPKAK